jgi:hypothetical protein
MTRWIFLIPCVFAFTTFAIPQETKHAPTFQSCDADLNLWSSQIPGFPTSNPQQTQEGTKSLTFHEMTDRASYLNDCAQAYPTLNKNRPGELSQLASLSLMYMSEIQARLFHFLRRHDLTLKFTEEDEAGKR